MLYADFVGSTKGAYHRQTASLFAIVGDAGPGLQGTGRRR